MRGTRGWKRGSQLFTLRLPSTLPLVSVDVCTMLAPTRVFNDHGSIVDHFSFLHFQLLLTNSSIMLLEGFSMVVTMRLVAVEGYQQVFREGILFLGIFLFFFFTFLSIFFMVCLKLCSTIFNFKNFAFFEILFIFLCFKFSFRIFYSTLRFFKYSQFLFISSWKEILHKILIFCIILYHFI